MTVVLTDEQAFSDQDGLALCCLLLLALASSTHVNDTREVGQHRWVSFRSHFPAEREAPAHTGSSNTSTHEFRTRKDLLSLGVGTTQL